MSYRLSRYGFTTYITDIFPELIRNANYRNLGTKATNINTNYPTGINGYYAETIIKIIRMLENLAFEKTHFDKTSIPDYSFPEEPTLVLMDLNNKTELEQTEKTLKQKKYTLLEVASKIIDNSGYIKIVSNSKNMIVLLEHGHHNNFSIDNFYMTLLLFYTNLKTKNEHYVKTLANLVNALIAKDETKIENILKELDEDKFIINESYSFLNNMQEEIRNSKVAEYEYQMIDLQNNVDYYRNQLAETATKIGDLTERIKFIKNETREDLTGLQAYLINHPYIKNIKKENAEQILLNITAPLIYYDTYLIDCILNGLNTDTEYKKFYKTILEIFKKNEYELITEAKIILNLENFRISTQNIKEETLTYLGHPHINQYGCLGNHDDAVYEWALNRDYIGCIEQICAAVLNLNFSDSIVIDQLIRVLDVNRTKKIWRKKNTQEMYSTDEILGGTN